MSFLKLKLKELCKSVQDPTLELPPKKSICKSMMTQFV